MGRRATVAQDSVWYQARINAAAYNDRLNSREGAAEEVVIDRGRLAKIEADLTNPYPEEVKMMAAEYHAPELVNHYCREVCPLGKDVPKAEIQDLDRITVRALATFRKLESTKQDLLEIAADGVIEEDEKEDLEKVLKDLKELEGVTHSLRLWVKKNLKEE